MCGRDITVEKSIFHAVIDNLVFLSQGDAVIPDSDEFQLFQPQKSLKYYPICDDFGPMNLASTTRFIEMLEDEIYDHPSNKIVFCADNGRRALTNAVYLLGAFLILRLNSSAADASKRFQWLDEGLAEPFRDATFARPDFQLALLDCWRALERGRGLGWVRYPSADAPEMWGMVNIDRSPPPGAPRARPPRPTRRAATRARRAPLPIESSTEIQHRGNPDTPTGPISKLIILR